MPPADGSPGVLQRSAATLSCRTGCCDVPPSTALASVRGFWSASGDDVGSPGAPTEGCGATTT